MADNITVTPGTGATVRTVDVGAGVEIQVMRLDAGSGAAEAQISAGQKAMAASLPVALASDQSAVPVNQAGVSATGSISAQNANGSVGAATAGSAVVLTLNGAAAFALDIRGTFSATVTFQGTIDGTNWFTINAVLYNNTGQATSVGSANAPGVWEGACGGLQAVRAVATAYASGTPVITLRGIPGAGLSMAVVTGSSALTVNAFGQAGTALMGAVAVGYSATVGTGASRQHLISAATTNSTSVKASAGKVTGWTITNTNAAMRFVKLHNTSSAPVAGSGVVQTIAVPAGQTVSYDSAGGIAFATGIAFTTVTGVSDGDTTAVAAGDLAIDLFYI